MLYHFGPVRVCHQGKCGAQDAYCSVDYHGTLPAVYMSVRHIFFTVITTQPCKMQSQNFTGWNAKMLWNQETVNSSFTGYTGYIAKHHVGTKLAIHIWTIGLLLVSALLNHCLSIFPARFQEIHVQSHRENNNTTSGCFPKENTPHIHNRVSAWLCDYCGNYSVSQVQLFGGAALCQTQNAAGGDCRTTDDGAKLYQSLNATNMHPVQNLSSNLVWHMEWTMLWVATFNIEFRIGLFNNSPFPSIASSASVSNSFLKKPSRTWATWTWKCATSRRSLTPPPLVTLEELEV